MRLPFTLHSVLLLLFLAVSHLHLGQGTCKNDCLSVLKAHLDSYPPKVSLLPGRRSAFLLWSLPPLQEKTPLVFEPQGSMNRASNETMELISFVQRSPTEWLAQNLIPLWDYKFWIAVYEDDSKRKCLGNSTHSSPIRILPPEDPSSAPRILRVEKMSHLRVNVSWQPPIHTSNKIVAYSIGIRGLSSVSKKVLYESTLDVSLDSSVHSSILFQVVRLPSLGYGEENTLYNISIRAVNDDGVLGDSSYQITSSSDGNPEMVTFFYFAGPFLYRKTVGLPSHLFADGILVYHHDENISSLSVLVERDLLYLLDDSGELFILTEVSKRTGTDTIIAVETFKSAHIREIEVDWLYLRLYLITPEGISACRLPLPEFQALEDCRNLWGGAPGLRALGVNPHQGLITFLSGEEALYGLTYFGYPHFRLENSPLKAYGLSISGGSILLPGENETTILDLHGRKKRREAGGFKGISSLIVNENGHSFFWVNEMGINYGEIDSSRLSRVTIDTSLVPEGLLLFGGQPHPTPSGPPRNVQAIVFGDTTGFTEIKWNAPSGSRFPGAWRDWKYVVRLQNLNSNETSEISETPCCSTNVHSLNQSHLYRVDVRVESSTLWSRAFLFGTLKSLPAECVLATSGRRQSLIRYKSLLPEDKFKFQAWDLDYNILEISGPLALTDSGKLVMGSPPLSLSNVLLEEEEEGVLIHSISYDEDASMLYVFSSNRVLYRVNLLNYERENLLSGLFAHKIATSPKRLCWSSINSLTCSKLNGEESKELFENKEERILAFCLGGEHPSEEDVYVLTSDSAALKYTLLHILDSQVSQLYSFSFEKYQFPQDFRMTCASQKIIWPSRSSGLFIYDLQGDSLSHLPLRNQELSSFAVMRPLQKRISPLAPFEVTQISLSGEREAFSVTLGGLPLEKGAMIRLSINSGPFFTIRKSPILIKNPNNLPAFNLSIYQQGEKTFSPMRHLTLMPPESIPHPPEDPRVFILDNEDPSLLLLRWNAPKVNNGRIISYGIVLSNEKTIEVNGSLFQLSFRPAPGERLLGIFAQNTKGPSPSVPFTFYDQEPPLLLYVDKDRNARLLDVDNGSNVFLRENVDFLEYTGALSFVWVSGGGIYSGINKGFMHYKGLKSIRVFMVHWLSRSVIWSEDGFEFLFIYLEEKDKAPKRLFQSPDRVMKALCLPEAILMLSEAKDLFLYNSSKVLSPVHCGDTLSMIFSDQSAQELLAEGCPNKSHTHKQDIVSNGSNLTFWRSSSDVRIIHSSYRNFFVSVNPIPVRLLSVYAPLQRLRSTLGKYRPCWTLQPLQTEVLNSTTSEITLNVSETERSSPSCLFYPLTSIFLSLSDGRRLSPILQRPSESVLLSLRNLSSFTTYDISLWRSNAFQKIPLSQNISLTTQEARPLTPLDFEAILLTPSSVALTWVPVGVSKDRPLTYKVLFRPRMQSSSQSSQMNTNESILLLKDLEPSTEYFLSLMAESIKNPTLGRSEPTEIFLRTYATPEQIQVTRIWPRRLELIWESPSETKSPIAFHQVLIHPKSNASDLRIYPSGIPESTVPSTAYTFDIVSHLSPNTDYVLKLRALYVNPLNASELNEFIWPETGASVQTSEDAPLAPGAPYPVENGSAVILKWNEIDANVRLYELYAQKSCGVDCEENWQIVYRGPTNAWGHLYTLRKSSELRFKVRCENSAGWSPYSSPSGVLSGKDFVLKAELRDNSSPSGITILWGALIFLILLSILGALFSGNCLPRSLRKGPWTSQTLVSSKFLGSSSRVTMRTSANNPLYNWMESDGNEDSLGNTIQSFPISALTFKNKIGSGAFGNVYKGILVGEDSGGRQTREVVALKTLKPSANSSTKKEFMREARIMSKFSHPNVLHLLGASIERGSTLVLVLELMERDLLATLRILRAEGGTQGETLLRFGLDVAKGCLYLTQMRHVHRDIAARNCLVSSPASDNSRIVKIGDFGLAREIYREDYYRRGGLMPVRWMSPESLEDGVYTHMSDVWSFGILLWEIITLGRQPYPGLSTHEVAEAVSKAGKRPTIPESCPAHLSSLMTRAWAFFPEERPSFQDCVNIIKELLLYREELNSIDFTRNGSGEEENYVKKYGIVVRRLEETPPPKPSTSPYLEVLSSNASICPSLSKVEDSHAKENIGLYVNEYST